MDIPNRNFRDVLDQPRANERLVDRIKGVPPARSKRFIEDILFDREIEGIEDWLYREFAEDHYFDMLLSDLAFIWLTRQSKDWLNQYATNIIEQSWLKCRERATEEEQVCYNRIKALIEHSRAGMSILFLEKCLKDLNHDEGEDGVLETDIYLLIAKLEEAKDELDTHHHRWSSIDIIKKPYLATVLIYINRKIAPSQCLDTIWHLNDNWFKFTSSHIDKLTILRTYMVTYIRQAMYRYLHPFNENNYRTYNAFIKTIKPEEWVNQILYEVFEWPGFESIKEKLKEISLHRSSENEHKQKLQDLDKKITSQPSKQNNSNSDDINQTGLPSI